MRYIWYIPRTVPRTTKKPKVNPYRQRQKRMKEKTPSPAKAYHDHFMATIRKNLREGVYDEIRKHPEDFRLYLTYMKRMARFMYQPGSAFVYPGVYNGMNKDIVDKCFDEQYRNNRAWVLMKMGLAFLESVPVVQDDFHIANGQSGVHGLSQV